MPLKCGPNIQAFHVVGNGRDPNPAVALALMWADFARSNARIQGKIARLRATRCAKNCIVRQGEIDAPVNPVVFTLKLDKKRGIYHAHIDVPWKWQVRCVAP
jgi:hypothetical protein